MNARIEAARAGEAGGVFNVVVQEMKLAIKMITEQVGKTSLSSESQAAATEEITEMVADVVQDFGNV